MSFCLKGQTPRPSVTHRANVTELRKDHAKFLVVALLQWYPFSLLEQLFLFGSSCVSVLPLLCLSRGASSTGALVGCPGPSDGGALPLTVRGRTGPRVARLLRGLPRRPEQPAPPQVQAGLPCLTLACSGDAWLPQ